MSYEKRTTFLFRTAVATTLVALPAHADTLTKGELFAGVADARQALADGFEVSFVFESDGSRPEGMIGYRRGTVAVRDGEILMESHAGLNAYDVKFKASSFDGTHSWRYQSFDTKAVAKAGPEHHQVYTETTGFFELMAWFPCREIRTGAPHPLDLESILASPASEVRPETETIDGRELHVVDVAAEHGDFVRRTLWIDVERGYLPVIHESYRAPDGGDSPELTMAWTITKAHEIVDGTWIPVEGTKEIVGAETNTMLVEADGDGYAATAQPEFSEDHFNYSTHLPQGGKVVYLDE